MTDPVALLQDLIRCPSVTPAEAGALDLVEKTLAPHGFSFRRMTFSGEGMDVDNLYAKWGDGAPHFCFAGHVDVVPPGNEKDWSFGPFDGEVRDGHVCGRGAADMKGPIAAFTAAVLDFIARKKPKGTISFLLAGDEEDSRVGGTKNALRVLDAEGEKIDFCLVGEPTSRQTLGDMVKIGRRGSFIGRVAVEGKQGHVAYPHEADNPVPKLVRLVSALEALELDSGTEHFQPSNLEIVGIDAFNKTENVIPARAEALFNVRFCDLWTGEKLARKLRETLDAVGEPHVFTYRISGESFYTPPGKYSTILQDAIEKETGMKPELSTSGGTSDARFIKDYCPVIEFGIVGKTMHKVDERVSLDDLRALTRIYGHVLESFFSAA